MRSFRCLIAALLLAFAALASVQTTATHAAGTAAAPDLEAAASPTDSMDPVLRAILFAMAARALRDAAASNDPLGSLADTLASSVGSVATSPQNLRTIEALAAHALKDAPPELRQAFSDFIVSALKHARANRPQTR